MTQRINLNDDRLFEAIWGSCCSQYPWYTTFEVHADAALPYLLVGVEDDASVRVSVGELRDAFNKSIRREWVPTNYDWTDEECDSDIDADIADIVLQVALFGKTVFA